MPSITTNTDPTPLPILTAAQKAKLCQEAKKENALLRLVLLIARGIRLNLDLIMLAIVLFVFVAIGYTYARVFGLTSKEITQEVSDIIELILLIISGLGAAILKLGMHRGALANLVGDKIDTFKSKMFRSDNELDAWGRTIVEDRPLASHNREKTNE